MTTVSNYALRLQSSLLNELRVVVEEEGTTLNQFINVAVAEKLAALRTERYFRERAARATPTSVSLAPHIRRYPPRLFRITRTPPPPGRRIP